MDSTPPLTRSPASPPNSYPSSAGFPSPELVAQHYRLSVVGSPCSMAPPPDSDGAVPQLQGMGQSGWGQSSMLHASSTGSAMSGIVSSGYDGFVTYDAGSIPGPHAYGYPHPDVYASQPRQQHQHLEPAPSAHSPARTPSRSPAVTSARSTTAGYAAGALLSQQPLTPRIKMEAAQPDYLQGADYPSPRSMHMPAEVGTYSAVPSSGYLSDTQSSAWSRDYSHSVEGEQPFYSIGGGQPVVLAGDRRPAQVRAHRPRTRKRLTTQEEANFQCEVKGCGKLFSRSYNFKAHMETHDQNREYPFPCGECSKKFVRKTDLQRHHQSVHMKERNHKCDFCGRLFARKDTLRRHMEDGCSRRFYITLPPMSISSMGNNTMLDPSSSTPRVRDGLQNSGHNSEDGGGATYRQGWGLS